MAAENTSPSTNMVVMAAENTSPSTNVSFDSTCYILELTAELRNLIYEYTVTEDGAIAVGASGFTTPGLLLSCRRIRSEANEMFYASNKFMINAPDYEATAAWKFSQVAHIDKIAVSQVSMTWPLPCKPNWGNVLKWLGWYYHREVVFGIGVRTQDPVARAVGRAFQLVDELEAAGCSWDTVKQALEVLHDAMDEYVHWV